MMKIFTGVENRRRRWKTSFSHTDMIHHEQVDVNLVCASSSDCFIRRSSVLDQLHTAPVTLPGGRHVRSVVSEVEGIMAAGIFAGVTVKTVQLFSGHALINTKY